MPVCCWARSVGASLIAILLSAALSGQELRLTLTADLSSKLPNGSPFTAKSDTGEIYHGHIVSRPAGHWLRRGSLKPVFDQHLTVVHTDTNAKVDSEGKIQIGHKRQVLGVSLSTVATMATDDYLVDPFLTSAGHKNPALYLLDSGVALGTLWIQKGGDTTLKRGTRLTVIPLRPDSIK